MGPGGMRNLQVTFFLVRFSSCRAGRQIYPHAQLPKLKVTTMAAPGPMRRALFPWSCQILRTFRCLPLSHPTTSPGSFQIDPQILPAGRPSTAIYDNLPQWLPIQPGELHPRRYYLLSPAHLFIRPQPVHQDIYDLLYFIFLQKHENYNSLLSKAKAKQDKAKIITLVR